MYSANYSHSARTASDAPPQGIYHPMLHVLRAWSRTPHHLKIRSSTSIPPRAVLSHPDPSRIGGPTHTHNPKSRHPSSHVPKSPQHTNPSLADSVASRKPKSPVHVQLAQEANPVVHIFNTLTCLPWCVDFQKLGCALLLGRDSAGMRKCSRGAMSSHLGEGVCSTFCRISGFWVSS